MFRAATGIDPPPSPIDAETYAQAGFPYFDLYKEISGVSGSGGFKPLKSINQVEKDRGLVGEVEPPVQPQQVAMIYDSPPSIVWPGCGGDVSNADEQAIYPSHGSCH